jgi:photoactive yellow protein
MLHLLTQLIDSLPVGVIVLDAAGRVVLYNRVEELLAGRRREDVLGSDFFVQHGFCLDVPLIGGHFRERIGRAPLEAEGDFTFPFPFLATPREVHVQLSSFEANGAPYGLLVLRDIAHERSVELMRQTLSQMLVHDIKNPLTAITMTLEHLALSPALRDDKDALDAVGDAVEASRRIESMLVNLLDTARLETNQFPLTLTKVDVHALARRAVSLEGAVARGNRALVTLVEAPAPVVAEVDADIVLRICENLVDNALRHAQAVTVAVYARDACAVIEVKDDGPGIPPEARAHIFDKFSQVPGGRERRTNRGLGLTFVQNAARAHGGDASLECPPEGGAVFRVVLPLDSPLPRIATR